MQSAKYFANYFANYMELDKLLYEYDITQDQLSSFMGVPRGRISMWLKNEKKYPPKASDAYTYDISANFFASIPREMVKKVIDNYHVVMGNIEHRSNGTPFSSGNIEIEKINSENIVVNKNKTKVNNKLIPYYDVDIMAGMGILYEDSPNYKPSYHMEVPQFSGCSAFPVYADSMLPLIEPGSIIFCTHIINWDEVLEYGQVYAIQLNDNRRFIKYIRKSKDDTKFLMRSANAEYDDFEIPKKNISQIWLVEGWMRKKTQ